MSLLALILFSLYVPCKFATCDGLGENDYGNYTMTLNARSNNDTKKYYAIGEVAALLNVSTSLIRFWEKKIPSLRPQKDKKGVRRYTQADIAHLRQVYHLVKEQGYTLQGAGAVMKGKQVGSDAEMLQTLKGLKSFLLSLKARLGND